MNSSPAFDPERWSGDPEDLKGYEEDLFNDMELCERTFAMKHEAFCDGFGLGETQGENELLARIREFLLNETDAATSVKLLVLHCEGLIVLRRNLSDGRTVWARTPLGDRVFRALGLTSTGEGI